MNYIKNTILIFIIVLLNACATSSDQATPQKSTIKNQDTKESLVGIENESDQLLQIFNGTKLKGAVLDTAYGAIEDAKIYTKDARIQDARSKQMLRSLVAQGAGGFCLAKQRGGLWPTPKEGGGIRPTPILGSLLGVTNINEKWSWECL